jgi:hypothetical protein
MHLSTAIDGMDQHKTRVPQFSQDSKDLSNAERLIVHVTGLVYYFIYQPGVYSYFTTQVHDYLFLL